MKYHQLQRILILLVSLSTSQVASKPASTNRNVNDYEDFEGGSFEVMSFDDKTNGTEESTFDNSFDYLDFPTLPPLRHHMKHADPSISNTSEEVSTLESNSTTSSSVEVSASLEEEVLEIDPEFFKDNQPSNSTAPLTPPTEDSNADQEDDHIAFERGGFVSLYSTENPPTQPPSSGNSSTRKPRRRLPEANYKKSKTTPVPHKRPNATSSASAPSNIEDPLQTEQESNAPPLNTRYAATPLPILKPLTFNLNAPALASHHADTPHRLVVELSAMEHRIQKRFKEVQEASDQTNKRITELTTWILSRDRDYLANKEQMKVEQEQRSTRVREFFKKASQSFESARRERATLYRNSESLKRMINSHKVHLEKELRRFAIGAGQNFGIVQEEVTRLFNMINRLSQIQNEDWNSSFPLE